MIEPYMEGIPAPTMYKINGVDSKISVKDTEVVELPWGGKLVFYNCIVGGVIDARFMPAILKGIMEKMEEGQMLRSAGVRLMAQTCLVISPLPGSYKNLITDSGKFASYLPSEHGIRIKYAAMEECVEAVTK